MSTDLALLASDPTDIESASDPAAYVVMACERAKTWLTQALEHGDIDQISELQSLKSDAETIRVLTVQKQLGKGAQTAAAEIVRRAERGIGAAIRHGQETGTVATRREMQSYAGRVARHQHGDNGLIVKDKPSPSDLVGSDELHNSNGILDMTDGVTDEQFEAALSEAKAEGNLSRANVVRKITGQTKRLSDRPEILRNTRRLDPNRIVEQTVRMAEQPKSLMERIDYTALDPTKLEEWVSSLTESISDLRALRTELQKEMARVARG